MDKRKDERGRRMIKSERIKDAIDDIIAIAITAGWYLLVGSLLVMMIIVCIEGG